MSPRTKVFAVVFFGAAMLLIGNIISNWGKITVHAVNKPLREVIASIERQGGVRILTNMDQATPVTMHVVRATLPEALDMLSVRAEGRIELAYLLAPTKPAVDQLAAAVAAGNRDAFTVARFGVPMMQGMLSEIPVDPRKMTWEPRPATPPDLATYLKQASMEVDASFFTPKDWNPNVASAPAKGALPKAVGSLAKAARASVAERFVLISFRNQTPRGEGRQGGWRQGGPPSEWRGGFSNLFNPETIAALERRAENQISQIPPDERPAARAEFDEMKKIWTELAALPPEQRREKMREIMENPKNQERMEERMNQRDMKSAPERRRDRYEDRVDRKFDSKYGAQQTR